MNKALLIGINYVGTNNRLNGCINDVKNVHKYIGERFESVRDVKDMNETYGKKKDEMVVLTLTDETEMRPTKDNILKAIDWLVKDSAPGDLRFLHYSGHGSNVMDRTSEEKDNRDECICPVDCDKEGMIIDDVLRVRLVDPLPAGVRLRCIFDCCHAGTMLDIPYCYTQTVFTRKYKMQHDKTYKDSNADVVCWSGCLDNQTSADAYWNGAFAGALTAGLLEILREKTNHTYESVFSKLTNSLAQKQYTQKPQLTSGKPLNIQDVYDVFQ